MDSSLSHLPKGNAAMPYLAELHDIPFASVCEHYFFFIDLSRLATCSARDAAPCARLQPSVSRLAVNAWPRSGVCSVAIHLP